MLLPQQTEVALAFHPSGLRHQGHSSGLSSAKTQDEHAVSWEFWRFPAFCSRLLVFFWLGPAPSFRRRCFRARMCSLEPKTLPFFSFWEGCVPKPPDLRNLQLQTGQQQLYAGSSPSPAGNDTSALRSMWRGRRRWPGFRVLGICCASIVPDQMAEWKQLTPRDGKKQVQHWC